MTRIAALSLIVALTPAAVFAAPRVDKAAPAFTAKDSAGKDVALADYKGKTVVLEWLNKGCPFVKKHYGAGNMQKLQKAYTEKGVVWLSVVSSADGKQGHVTGAEADADTKASGASPSAVLLDPAGKLGKLYGAKTTPHMYVVDKDGVLRYNGAIDSDSSSDPASIASAENYVAGALDAVLAGKKVKKRTTKPYGCSVKYAD
ncbi:MAG: redoxin domain-containing protein [Elusimicrobia bacterium]|nr:redoxin domain-containing protein [Elusimicrobiota bacterium]